MNMTPFQKNNLLVFLDRVTTKGIDEANALLEVFELIRTSEQTDNIPQPEVQNHTENSAPLPDKQTESDDSLVAPPETPAPTPPPASV